jgi:hypothetical protein
MLIRSAAVGYRERVVGLILSGIMDDGTTGLWWIRRYGGIVVVQDSIRSSIQRNARERPNSCGPKLRCASERNARLSIQLANGDTPA